MQVREIIVTYGKAIKAPASIRTPEAAAAFVRQVIRAGEPREHVVAVYLDVQKRPLGWGLVSIGTATEATVHPRETYRGAILASATGVILAHNHPSGVAEPSEQDCSMTARFSAAGRIVGIELVDHLVISDEGFSSLRQSRPDLWIDARRIERAAA